MYYQMNTSLLKGTTHSNNEDTKISCCFFLLMNFELTLIISIKSVNLELQCCRKFHNNYLTM